MTKHDLLDMTKQGLLVSPRGFCAGVDRAIKGVVTLSVAEKMGLIEGPLYQNHAAVHNEEVVKQLEKLGAPVQENVNLVPMCSIYVFSAHGVSPQMRKEAEARELRVTDLTCQLVTRVHSAVIRKIKSNHITLYLCKTPKHAEAAGVIGENPGKIFPITCPEDIDNLSLPEGADLFFTTQTTLSATDVKASSDAMKKKFPKIEELDATCYATTNRQDAVVQLISETSPDLLLVVGSNTSSNTKSLVKRGKELNVNSHLIHDRTDIDPEWLSEVDQVLITSGASTPDYLVTGVVAELKEQGINSISNHVVKDEGNIIFTLPDQIKELELKIQSEIRKATSGKPSEHTKLLASLIKNPFVKQYLFANADPFTLALRR